VLSQADFAMSKIAANESYGGSTLKENEFLMQRRLLMAKKIKDYYFSL
jgi:hypothetical protein